MSLYSSNVMRPQRVPRLLPLSPAVLPTWNEADGRVFRVLAEGSAAGLDLLRGDLLLTRGGAAVNQVGILIPRGYGRPMVGVRTERGLRAEPGGVDCSLERWSMRGRLVARARSFRIRPRSGQVVRDVEGVEYPPELESQRGAWIAVDLGTRGTPEILDWMNARARGAREVGSTRLIAECDWMHEGCPMMRGGSLIAELRDHFGLKASVGIASTVPAAVAAMAVAMPSAVVAVEPGCEAVFAEPWPLGSMAQTDMFGGSLASAASLNGGAM